jgi:hypothetical protein
MLPNPPREHPDPPITIGRRLVPATRDGNSVVGAALARVHRVALRVDPRRAALVLGALVVLFTVLGSLYRLGAPLALFDLDREGRPPAAFSGALLVCAGVLGWLIGDTAAEVTVRGRWRAIATLFVFLGVDEMLTIHESLDDMTGVFWQVLYLPIGLLAGVIWLMVLGRLRRDGRERLLFIGAPLAWLISQLLEAIQHEPDAVPGYAIMATAEESLEMIGSTLFLLGLLMALQTRSAAREADPEH